MLYFRDAPYHAASKAEEEQFQKIQTFKQKLVLTDKPLIWEFDDEHAFRGHLHNRLWKFVTQQLRLYGRSGGPLSFLRVAVSANRVCARAEGMTDLVGNLG